MKHTAKHDLIKMYLQKSASFYNRSLQWILNWGCL